MLTNLKQVQQKVLRAIVNVGMSEQRASQTRMYNEVSRVTAQLFHFKQQLKELAGSHSLRQPSRAPGKGRPDSAVALDPQETDL